MNMISPKTVILFDNDGTLTNSIPAVARATNAALQAHGFPELTTKEIAEGMRYETIRRMARHARIADDVMALILSRNFYRYLEKSPASIPLFDGVTSTLIKLHEAGIRMGIVSNNRQLVVKRILEANGVGEYFSFVIGEDTADEPKPAPGGILQACRRFGVGTEACLMVGDSMSDSLAASAANMRSVGVSWNHHDTTPVESMGFSMTIDHPEELLNLVQVS